MSDKIYTPELVGSMDFTYRSINTDLMVVIQSLIDKDILRTSQLELKIKENINGECPWNFTTNDIGKAANKLFNLGILERYKRQINHRENLIGQHHYCYCFSPEGYDRERHIATAALKVLGENDASIVELTQSKVSVNTIKLLIAFFQHSLLDMSSRNFAEYRSKFKTEDYMVTFSELIAKTGLVETTLCRQLANLEEYGFINRLESEKSYRVMGDLSGYKSGNYLGSTEKVLVSLGKEKLRPGGSLEVFTISSLYEQFAKKPDKKMLKRKIEKLAKEGYFSIQDEAVPLCWQLKGKGARIGLNFVIPLQRYLMDITNLSFLKDQAESLVSSPSDLERCVTRVFCRYSQISGHVGKPGTKKPSS